MWEGKSGAGQNRKRSLLINDDNKEETMQRTIYMTEQTHKRLTQILKGRAVSAFLRATTDMVHADHKLQAKVLNIIDLESASR